MGRFLNVCWYGHLIYFSTQVREWIENGTQRTNSDVLVGLDKIRKRIINFLN